MMLYYNWREGYRFIRDLTIFVHATDSCYHSRWKPWNTQGYWRFFFADKDKRSLSWQSIRKVLTRIRLRYAQTCMQTNLMLDFCLKCKRRNTEDHKMARGDVGRVRRGRRMNQPPWPSQMGYTKKLPNYMKSTHKNNPTGLSQQLCRYNNPT